MSDHGWKHDELAADLAQHRAHVALRRAEGQRDVQGVEAGEHAAVDAADATRRRASSVRARPAKTAR